MPLHVSRTLILGFAISGLNGCLAVDSGLSKPDLADGSAGSEGGTEADARAGDSDAGSSDATGRAPGSGMDAAPSQGTPGIGTADSGVNNFPFDGWADASLGGTSGDAGGGYFDAGSCCGGDSPFDASSWSPDAAQIECRQDADCGAERICSLASGRCMARCDAVRGCAGPQVDRLVTLVSADDDVYWVTAPTEDALGNQLPNGGLWRWDRSSAPVQVASNLTATGALAFIIDGHAYFTGYSADGTRPLRVALGANAMPAGPWTVYRGNVWFTEHYVWWATEPDDHIQKGGIHRVARRADASPELVREVSRGGETLLVATEQFVFSQVAQEIYREALDGTSRTLIGSSPNPWTHKSCRVYGSQLVCRSPSELSRGLAVAYDVNGASEQRVVARFIGDDASESYLGDALAVGAWLYWDIGTSTRIRARLMIGRTLLDLSRTPEVLADLDVPGGGGATSLAVSRNGMKVAFYHNLERRIFELTAPPLPCSVTLPCPAQTSCQSDQTCR